ncbi:MAG: thioredoxin-like domain-containing protein [bacterium]
MKPLLMLLVFLLNPYILLGGVQITGQIYGADGQPPILSHVHLTTIGGHYSDAIQSVQAHQNGTFEIELPGPGLYRLWVSAVNHTVVGVPLIVEPDDSQVNMTITLSPYSYKESLDEVRIIGDWNSFKFSTAKAMQKQPDGTFIFEVEAQADTLGYQLLGIVEEMRSVNGTMADYFVYDGGGDYRSVLRGQKGKVKIVFDPSKLSRSIEPELPKITFAQEHLHLAEYFNIDQRFEKKRAEFFEALQAYRKKHEDTKDFSFDFSSLQSSLEQIMQQASDLKVRQFAAMYLAQLPMMRWELAVNTYDEVMNLVPPTSSFWGINSYLPISVSNNLDTEKPDSLLQIFYEQNPNRKVQAQVLAYFVMKASRANEKEKVDSLYQELKTKYGDVGEIQFYLKQLDPNRRIAEGKPVPDFEVKLMNRDKTISNKSLLGKFYMLDFWAVWCGPCVAEMPNLHHAYEKFKDKNFTIVSLSFDPKVEDVQKFRARQWKMPWLHVFVEDAFNNEIAKKFEVLGIPKPLLVNPRGIIVATEFQLRGKNLETTLTKYLGEPGTN